MFGEWLVKHVLEYPDECYENVYCFDVFDMENKVYLPQKEVKILVERLGLKYVPVFFEGKFTKWDDYMHLVGKTELGGGIGEGIIIKNMSTLGYNVAYTKIVHERFREVKHTSKSKPSNVERNREHERLMELAKTIVTKQRVEKLLYKLIDEGIIPQDISNKDIQVIMKNLPSAVYHDCIREEPKIVNQIEHFGKYSGNITVAIIKRIISEKGQKND